MLSRIFEIPSSLSLEESSESVLEGYFNRQCASKTSNKLLINGPRGCGKTSLLFSLAVSFAEEGKDVLFMSPRKLHKLPAYPEGKQRPLTNVLQRIRMVYLESANELLKYLASTHLNQSTTVDCMIIDGLDLYIKNGQKNEDLSMLARILAYAVDAYEFQQTKSSSSTILAISVVYSKQNLYERGMDHILKVTIQKDNKHDEKVCKMSVCQPYSNALVDVYYDLTNTHYTITQIIA